MKILVTGFDPFGGETVNPSLEIVRLLPDRIGQAELIKLEVPTSFQRSLPVIERAIRETDPDVILSVGQAGGRAAVSVERIGINLSDARIPDNDGFQPVDQPVAEDGPTAYFATVPVRRIVERLRRAGIPAVLSYSAGTFVCNHVLYGVCHLIASHYPHKKSGFIHIPYLPAQTVDKPEEPSMSQETALAALKLALTVLSEEGEGNRTAQKNPSEKMSFHP